MRPRKFKYKSISKRRRLRFGKSSNLSFGTMGLKSLNPVRLNSTQIFRYKLLLKKSAKKHDKTLRFVWFNLFPHMPISRKVAGSRMGKGKGKLAGWSTELPSGIMMFEFKNLRFGRFMYFINQVNSRIPSKTMVILNHRNKIQLPLNKSKMINYDVVW